MVFHKAFDGIFSRYYSFSVIMFLKLNLTPYTVLLFYQVPEEEKNLGPRDRLVHVYHFFKDNHVCIFKRFEVRGSLY